MLSPSSYRAGPAGVAVRFTPDSRERIRIRHSVRVPICPLLIAPEGQGMWRFGLYRPERRKATCADEGPSLRPRVRRACPGQGTGGVFVLAAGTAGDADGARASGWRTRPRARRALTRPGGKGAPGSRAAAVAMRRACSGKHDLCSQAWEVSPHLFQGPNPSGTILRFAPAISIMLTPAVEACTVLRCPWRASAPDD